MEPASNNLHPWPVIQSFLCDLDSSDEFVRLVLRAGIKIDTRLEHRDDYSHSTRFRSYLPRLQQAVENFNKEEKLRISAVIACELIKKEKLSEGLQTSLERIGWTIKDGMLTTLNRSVIDLFCPKHTEYDAYVGIRKIFTAAKLSLDVIDPYIDGTILEILARSPATTLKVRILTTKMPPDFSVEIKKFKQQHNRFDVEIRKANDFHDRFIIRDSKECFHLGHSIKDFGSKASMLSEFRDEPNRAALNEQFEKSWQSADQTSPRR